jgi:hypothetical protein
MPGLDGGSNAVPFLRRLLRREPRPYVVVLTMIGHGRGRVKTHLSPKLNQRIETG